jgi:hypothetical protein
MTVYPANVVAAKHLLAVYPADVVAAKHLLAQNTRLVGLIQP